MDTSIAQRMRVRRRTAANWTALDEVLLDSEFGLETDKRKLKVGDGVTPWSGLKYIDSAILLSLLADVDKTDREGGRALTWNETLMKHAYTTITPHALNRVIADTIVVIPTEHNLIMADDLAVDGELILDGQLIEI